MEWNKALEKVEKKKEGKDPPFLIVKYERRSCGNLRNNLMTNHAGMLSRDPRLVKAFPAPPKPVFARHRNLKEFLTRGKLPPVRHATRHSTQVTRSGTSRCNKGTGRQGCLTCPYITDRPNEVLRVVKFPSSGLTEKVEGRLTCKQGGGGRVPVCGAGD